MSKFGIDVSYHQGELNWEKLKPQIEYAIIRSGHGMNEKDTQFERNYAECKRLGIPVGVYHYFYYSDLGKHHFEMDNFLSIISGKTFDFPVFVDYEEGNFLTPSKLGYLKKDALTALLLEDLARIKKAGFKAGVYANKNWLTNKIHNSMIPDDCMVWLAHYVPKTDYQGRYEIHQYTSSSYLNGYGGKLDCNRYYPPVDQGVVEPVKLGERSSRVVKMQELLRDKAYKVSVDGVFGTQTLKVLKQFQLENGLKVDGVCGKATWAKLDSVVRYSRITDGEKYVSKNFQVKELACKDGSDEILVCSVAAERIQALRDAIGKPIIINSGYRTPAWNKSEGGEDNSLHMKGYAIDFYVVGMNPAQVQAMLYNVYQGGLGVYSRFTHIDSGRRRRW